MRIRASNQLSADARTLGFGSGWSLAETDGDVEVVANALPVAVPAPTGVVSTDWGNISAAVTKAQAIVAAGGNAEVWFQGCPYANSTLTPYAIGPNSIPITTGISYIGRPPVAVNVGVAGAYGPDNPWVFQGGTVIQGDGTAPGFWDGQTDFAGPVTNQGGTTISQVRIDGFGIQNVTYGIQCGAKNIQGLSWCDVDNIYVRNATQWGVYFVNFFHVAFGKIRTCVVTGCVGGQYYGIQSDQSNFHVGFNSTWADLFQIADGDPALLTRGIVFDSNGTKTGGGVRVSALQVNGFNRTAQSETVNFTNASASVAVADGTQYAVKMPVWFTATQAGFTKDIAYIVTSVSGNTITLATSRSGANIAATATTTGTLHRCGMALVEAGGSSSTSALAGVEIHAMDIETGGVTGGFGLLVENVSRGFFRLNQTAGTDYKAELLFRSVSRVNVQMFNEGAVDSDLSDLLVFGSVSSWPNARVPGMVVGPSGDMELQLRQGQGQAQGADAYLRKGGLYGGYGFCTNVDNASRGNATNAETASSGIRYITTAGATITLPTIVDSTTTRNSLLGMTVDYLNVSGGNATLATDGTQLFNNVVAKTSITIATGAGVRVVAVPNGSGGFAWAATTLTAA